MRRRIRLALRFLVGRRLPSEEELARRLYRIVQVRDAAAGRRTPPFDGLAEEVRGHYVVMARVARRDLLGE